MKRFFLIVGVLLLTAVVTAGLAAPGFYDWNRHTDVLARYIEAAVGYSVEIDGDIEVALLPSPRFSATDIRVADPGSQGTDAVLASLASIDVQLALGPLLRGEIEFREIALENPELHFARLPDGRRNWLPAPPSGARGDGPAVAVETLVTRSGTVAFRDPARGIDVVLDNVVATVTAGSLRGPFQASGTFETGGVRFEFSAASGVLEAGRPTGLSVEVVLAGRDHRLSFRGTHSRTGEDWRLHGDLGLEGPDFGDLADAVAATMEWEAPALSALDASYAVAASVETTRIGADIGEVDLRLADMSASGDLRVGWTDAPTFEASLAATQLDLDALLSPDAAWGRPSVGAAFQLPAALSGALALSADAITYRGQLVRGARLEATFADGAITVADLRALLPGVTTVVAAGTVAPAAGALQFDGAVEARSGNAREFLQWLGLDPAAVPDRQLRTFEYDGRLRLSPYLIQAYHFDAEFDRTRVSGSLGYALRERPAFSIDADVDR